MPTLSEARIRLAMQRAGGGEYLDRRRGGRELAR
jgi:hypothetical protein